MLNRKGMLALAVLSALVVLACGGPDPADVTDEEALAALDPNAVCDVLSREELKPYEQLGVPASDADATIEDGWTFGGQPAFGLEPPIDWEHLAAIERSWNFHLNSWWPVDAILMAHTSSAQSRYLSFALALAGDWIDQNPYPAPESESGVEDFGWYDMAVGLRIYRLSYILDAACRDTSVPAEEIRQIWGSLLDHFDYLSDDDNIAFHSNHGLYQVAGQFVAATRLSGFKAISPIRAQAVSRFERMIDQQFSSEGVHLEHSPGYQRDVMDVIAGIAPSGLLDEFPSLSARMEGFEEALAWMVLPNRRLANLGDTDYHDLSEEDVAGVHSPLLLYALSGGLQGKAPSERLGIFPDSGLAVLRSGWPDAESFDEASYLAQQAAFHSRTHKQADDLSFIWYDRGTEILIDAGRYGYPGRTEPRSDLWNRGFWYSDPKRIYVESTRSHNTVEIDGMSFNRRQSPPYGSAIVRWGETDEGLLFVETQARQFETIIHDRLLVLNPQKWLLVYDWLWDDVEEDHDYRQWFQFAPDLIVESHTNSLRVSGESLDEDLTVVSLLRSPVLSDPVSGQDSPELLGWWSERGGEFEPVTSVNFSVPQSGSAVFATLFSFSDTVLPDLDYQRVDHDGRNGRFRWTATNFVHTISFAKPTKGDLAIDYMVESVP